MRKAFILAMGLAATAHAGDTVWKWKDANGNTHLSDQPVPGAEQLNIRINGTSATVVDVPPPSSSSSNATAPETYRAVEILKPENEQTIPNSGGQVSVGLRTDPALRPGDQLALYLDGTKVDVAPNALEVQLKDVPRGTHNLAAAIFDPRGKKLLESAGVTFYVQQASVAHPPTGPTLQPRPRP